MENIPSRPKNYQLHVTILEARHLDIQNVNTIVVVQVANKRKQIKAKTKKTENPYFNELFKFSFFEPLEKFLKHHLRLSVHKVACFKIIGSCEIELTTVWAQLGCQFYHKWAVLSDPKDLLAGLKGYLKCNIQILAEGIPQIKPSEKNSDDIEGNLLLPFTGHQRRKTAIFSVNIFRADGINCKTEKCGREVQLVCKNMFVKVNFAGQNLKTKVVYSEAPAWNEALNFIEAVPSLFRTITIELWDRQHGILIGSTTLSLGDLWNQSDVGALPSFGPAYTFVYQKNKRNLSISLSGRVLLAITCELLDRGNPQKTIQTARLQPFDENKFSPCEEFSLFFALFNCVFFKKKKCSKFRLLLHHGANFTHPGEISTSNGETFVDVEIKKGKLTSWSCQGEIPTAEIRSFWPNTYDREYRYNEIKHILKGLSQKGEELQRLYDKGDDEFQNSAKDSLLKMNETCNKILSFDPYSFETILDKARRVELREKIRKIKAETKTLLNKETVHHEDIISLFLTSVSSIVKYTDDPQKTFPDIEISIAKLPSKNVTKRNKITLKTEDYIFSDKDGGSGQKCGKRETLFLRDFSGNDVAAVDAFLWFGKTCNFNHCSEQLPGMKSTENSTIKVAESHVFELRVHLYQGRINPGADASGLADPFVRIIAFGEIRETQIMAQTLDPIWDETLLFSRVTIYGDLQYIEKESTGVVIEAWDYDGNNAIELIGRGSSRPKVQLLKNNYEPPTLKSQPIFTFGEQTAEILMAMELLELSADSQLERQLSQEKIFSIPSEIRPHFKEFILEIIFWGVRNLRNACLPPAPKIMALMECNGVRIESSLACAESSFNFDYNILQAVFFLPEEEEYKPPLNLFLYEFSCFDNVTLKGSSVVPFVSRFLDKSTKVKLEKQPNEASPTKKLNLNFNIKLDLFQHHFPEYGMVELDEHPDWWTKFYASKHKIRQVQVLKIYSEELEKQPEFKEFQDFLYTFPIMKGKTDLRKSLARQDLIANAKCCLKLLAKEDERGIEEIPEYFSNHPSNEPLDVTVRVYIISAYDLTPTDINGRCDPYISLSVGKIELSDRKNYTYKETDPIFGKCFELQCTFPWDHTLRIRVMDHDVCACDNLIGQTSVDLENRFYTKHYARCGIPDTYNTEGYCEWRDLLDPYEILNHICKQCHMPELRYSKNRIQIGTYSIPTEDKSQEYTALKVLNDFHNVPDYGFHLVPEHVETRTLFHPEQPNIEQGKLEMWIDIFPGHSSLPLPVNVTPRGPQNLELRVIVWNTSDVIPADVSLITREKSSDIFVKAWLSSPDESQRTDIHYRSLTGEGNFNWRFIFPFVYSPDEHKMITWKAYAFSKSPWKIKLPCILELQLWDNDLIVDDFIGSLSLNLAEMPHGAKSTRSCTLEMLESSYPKCSLFKLKRVRGWWPFRVKDRNQKQQNKLAGKIDMELEVVTQEQSTLRPVGLGREGPSPLSEPNRPQVSFFWALNPLKMANKLLFSGIGKKLTVMGVIAALGLFVVAGWLAIPGLLLKKLLKA